MDLHVHATLSVSVSESQRAPRLSDTDLDLFFAAAESGEDRMATVLCDLEGDIANGGFLQLFENKGPEFMREALSYLDTIGAARAATLLGLALELLDSRASVLLAYDDLLIRLVELDSRFDAQEDAIAHLYLAHAKGA